MIADKFLSHRVELLGCHARLYLCLKQIKRHGNECS